MENELLELTDRQKEALQKLANNIKEFAREVWEKLKQAINQLKEAFQIYVSNLEPKKRYKFLKSIGVRNYIPFFKRKVFRCRNNC